MKRYQLFFPTPNARGSTMLDYFMGEKPSDRTYECVYRGEIDHPKQDLHFLWQRHNEGDNLDGNRPKAREMRSMCVGDIIVIHDIDDSRAWVVDREGFTEIVGEDPSNIGALLDSPHDKYPVGT